MDHLDSIILEQVADLHSRNVAESVLELIVGSECGRESDCRLEPGNWIGCDMVHPIRWLVPARYESSRRTPDFNAWDFVDSALVEICQA